MNPTQEKITEVIKEEINLFDKARYDEEVSQVIRNVNYTAYKRLIGLAKRIANIFEEEDRKEIILKNPKWGAKYVEEEVQYNKQAFLKKAGVDTK